MAESEDTSVGKQVTDGLKTILQRIPDFFCLCDLSFLVFGITTMVALLFGAERFGFATRGREAGRYMIFQVEELAASLAATRALVIRETRQAR